MNSPLIRSLLAIVSLLGFCSGAAIAQPVGWKHTGSVWALTTPDGANLPAPAVVNDFPLLVRLHKDFFEFTEAKPDGADIRFTTSAGVPLAYQIEEWDPTNGRASIWVRVPMLQGNARHELKVYWGRADAEPQSNGASVFNVSNDYLSVWHMTGPVKDEVGTLPSTDLGTTATPGIVGVARHFPGRQGVFCGEKIPNYPSGGTAHSTQAWFRAERPNTTIIGWGNEGGGRGSKVRMQLRSPPHVHVDSDFSDVDAPERLPMGEWAHVVHTYANSEGRIYINGQLAGSARPTLNIKPTSRLWLGGWYHNYDFVGDLDEVRVSSVARSANWVRLEYENQKPLQTLVGLLVRSGDVFSVSHTQVTVVEGKAATITANAGGAQKVYWSLKRDGRESVVAVDRFAYTFDAGRVVGDQAASLQFKAVYPDGVKTKDIAINIREAIPEPEFALMAPQKWDGRQTIEVVPQITNMAAMQSCGAGELKYRWSASGIASTKDVMPGKLILHRAQNSGGLTITLALSNGGTEIIRSTTILVEEPKSGPWVQRIPAKDEKPQDNQFYARDDKNEGTLYYRGTLAEVTDSVFLRLYADDKLVTTETQKLGPAKTYALTTKLKPGLINYRVEFGSKTGDRETVLHTAANLVCGDAYLIDGQSNAEATDVGKEDPPFTSEWIHSYGSMSSSPDGARLKGWGPAVCRDRQGGKGQVGYWGLELARRLVENQKMPICIINGAVGGSRIDQHQRNSADPEDVTTIYGRLLWRVRQAGLTHGIRGILWHQGENDQGADGPTGGFGWETYRDFFIEMAAGWKKDYPNVQHFYVFQIWPRACSMGINGSDNMLREVQRTLPTAFSKLSLMSTLGIKPPGGCHFPIAGYAEFARLICPLVERDNYGKVFPESITPPNLLKAAYTSNKKDEITLEFDQPVVWADTLASQFVLDGARGRVISGSVTGNVLRLKLTGPANAQRITYLDSRDWAPTNILLGGNGIAALTFCNVPIAHQ